MYTVKIDSLSELSIKREIDPLIDIDFSDAPSEDQYWMSPHLLSLYGTKTWEMMNESQRKKLSHLEFSLLCSLSCFGEKEVIANIARLMLKKKYESVRKYLYFFIKEENNHIFMFSEFCSRYGQHYPSLYSYVKDSQWEDPEIDEMLVFIHVLIFEELGNMFNRIMSKDKTLPELVRVINYVHTADESRHISFGRKLVEEMSSEILSRASSNTIERLKSHIRNYLDTRHYEYHNMNIYKTIGLDNAFELRQELITIRDFNYFSKDAQSEFGIRGLRKFLNKIGLLDLE